MKLLCVLETDYKGDPRIKITKDAPQITLTVYTEDLNLLRSLVDRELYLTTNAKE